MHIFKELPRLERWVEFHNVLVGYAHNFDGICNGQRVITNNVKHIDHLSGIAKCTGDEEWMLGKPGSYAEHSEPQKKGLIPNLKSVFEDSFDKISDIKKMRLNLFKK